MTAETVGQAVEQVTAARKLLRLVRYPGYEAVLTIDGAEHRIVRLKINPNVTEILFEESDV